VLYAI